MINITTEISFSKEDVFTNIFGEKFLLYTIIKDLKINNKEATTEETKYILEKTNLFTENFFYHTFEYIDIKKKINSNYNFFIIKGFREAIFKDNLWYDKNLYDTPPFIDGCLGFNQYINNHEQVNTSINFKNDNDFMFFVENHDYNKFYKDEDFYTIKKNKKNCEILIYKDGLLDILTNLLSNEEIKNENSKNLIKYLFCDFNLDLIEKLKKTVLSFNNLYKNNKDNFDYDLECYLNTMKDFKFSYIKSKTNNIASSKFFFNIPIMNDFKESDLSFNFSGNLIPITPEKAILISKKSIDIELEKIDLFILSYVYNLMEELYYSKKGKWIRNNFIYYENMENRIMNNFINYINNGPNRANSCLKEELIHILGYEFENIKTTNGNEKICLKSMIL